MQASLATSVLRPNMLPKIAGRSFWRSRNLRHVNLGSGPPCISSGRGWLGAARRRRAHGRGAGGRGFAGVHDAFIIEQWQLQCMAMVAASQSGDI
jgi:hypothetical protein